MEKTCFPNYKLILFDILIINFTFITNTIINAKLVPFNDIIHNKSI